MLACPQGLQCPALPRQYTNVGLPSATAESALFVVFLNDTATTEIYTLSLHDALPIYAARETLRNGVPEGKSFQLPLQYRSLRPVFPLFRDQPGLRYGALSAVRSPGASVSPDRSILAGAPGPWGPPGALRDAPWRIRMQSPVAGIVLLVWRASLHGGLCPNRAAAGRNRGSDCHKRRV